MRDPATVHRVTVRFFRPEGVDQLRVYRIGGYDVGVVCLRTHMLLDLKCGGEEYIIEAIDGRRLTDKQATFNPDTDPWWFSPTHP